MSARLLGDRRRYLTVGEYSSASGEKPDTIRKRCERGVLRCRKTGTRWRIWAGELGRSEPRVR